MKYIAEMRIDQSAQLAKDCTVVSAVQLKKGIFSDYLHVIGQLHLL